MPAPPTRSRNHTSTRGAWAVTTAGDILADAIAADAGNAGIVNLLESDPDLERLVVVWANVPLPTTMLGEECPADLPLAVRLRWVWSLMEPDPVPAWISFAGLPDAPHVRRAVMLAIDNRIVLPNGVLSTWAQVYIQQRARRTLGIGVAPASESTAPEPPPPPPPPTPLPLEEGMIQPRRRLRPAGEGV